MKKLRNCLNTVKYIISFLTSLYFLCVIAFIFVFCSSYVFASMDIKKEVMISMGDDIVLELFLNGEEKHIRFDTDTSLINTNQIKDYKIKLKNGLFTYTSALFIKDTNPPCATPVNLSGFADIIRAPEDFVCDIVDETKVSVSFVAEPDYTKSGTQEVKILLTDEGNNQTVVTASLNLEFDKTPPKIYETMPLNLYLGDPIDYERYVYILENRTEKPTISVDTSKVKENKVGDYPITYTVTDHAGNVSIYKTILHIQSTPSDYPGYDKLTELADKVLAEIITPDMTDYEKAHVIFDWIRYKIRYSYDDYAYNLYYAAYNGLAYRKADCFACSAASIILMERAGFDMICVEKSNSQPCHYWAMANVGDNWYHFDPLINFDAYLFLLTDKEMRDFHYYNRHANLYDHNLYPPTPSVSIHK